MKMKIISLFSLFLFIISFGPAYSSSQLILPENFVYKGAFKLPYNETSPEEKSWSYGGTAFAYYPKGDANEENDGYPGSLFGAGHEQFQYISEINIPKPVKSKNLDNLNTAKTLQDFHDIKGNLFGSLELPRVGLAYLPKQGKQKTDKLYFAWGQHMQEERNDPSHGWFELDLSDPKIKGPWRIANHQNYVTTGYLFSIPKSWAKKYTPGKLLVTGRYRDGGQGAQGPSMFAYGPWNDGNPPPQNSSLPNATLLLYSNVYDDPNGRRAMKNYQHSDNWAGGAWLTLGKKSAVIFVGIKGKGECWYGYYDGTVWPDNPPYPKEGPGERGWWSEKFEAQIIFYKASDLAKAAKKKIPSYKPQPYKIMSIEKYLFYKPKNEFRRLGGVTFDHIRKILYIAEFRGNQANQTPIVHVWKIK